MRSDRQPLTTFRWGHFGGISTCWYLVWPFRKLSASDSGSNTYWAVRVIDGRWSAQWTATAVTCTARVAAMAVLTVPR